MLHELARYAENKGLAARPGYKVKRVRWVIVLDELGQYVGVAEIERGHDEFVVPHLEQSELVSGSVARSHFLVDSLAVVTGLGNEPGQGDKSAKRASFIKQLYEAAAQCSELSLCAALLENVGVLDQINALLAAQKAKATENVMFRVDSRNTVELEGWRPWWAAYRAGLHPSKTDDAQMVCLLSGELVSPVATHSKVSGLSRVGGQPSGSNLISFDKEAFGSYSLAQSANAACGESGVALYRAALDDLVLHAPPPLGGALILHWYDQPVAEGDDPFSDIAPLQTPQSPTASAGIKARELLTAVRHGRRPDLTHNRYFVLEVSGSGGRVMVRDWFTGDFVVLVEHLCRWFDDLELIGPRGGAPTEPPKLQAALTRMISYRPGEGYSDLLKRIDSQLAPLLPRLWRSILEDSAVPDAAAQGALAYARSRLLREDADQSIGNLDRLACQVLKVWLIRKAKGKGIKENLMGIRVNPDHPSPAYHAGRLMAVLAAVQETALPNVGAGIVQRYYAAASTTPALVLGRLVRNAQFHLQKIESKGLMYWYESLISDIMVHLGDRPPATLDLEGQSLFALGYYQQKADMYSRAAADSPTVAPAIEHQGGN